MNASNEWTRPLSIRSERLQWTQLYPKRLRTSSARVASSGVYHYAWKYRTAVSKSIEYPHHPYLPQESGVSYLCSNDQPNQNTLLYPPARSWVKPCRKRGRRRRFAGQAENDKTSERKKFRHTSRWPETVILAAFISLLGALPRQCLSHRVTPHWPREQEEENKKRTTASRKWQTENA